LQISIAEDKIQLIAKPKTTKVPLLSVEPVEDAVQTN